jgi:hypothetical protein
VQAVQAGGAVRGVQGGGDPVPAPDGKPLASAGHYQTIKLWDIPAAMKDGR